MLTEGLSKSEIAVLIASETGLKFAKMEADIYDNELRKSIGLVCAMLGIKTTPDQSTLKYIKNIFDHFHFITPAEFLEAFRLNILDAYPEPVQHFQLFDATYVSRVLGYYRHFKAETQKKLMEAHPKQIEQPKSTNKQFYDGLKAFVEEKKEFPKFWNFSAAFEHLRETGQITESLEWRNNLKEKVRVRMQEEIIKLKLKSRNSIEMAIISDSLNPTTLQIECQKEYLYEKLFKK